MRRTPLIRGAAALATAVLLWACGDDRTVTLDQGADVDDGAVIAGVGDVENVVADAPGASGTADVTFAGTTVSVAGVACRDDGRLAVTPIVADSFTLTVEGDPASGVWDVQVVQEGDPLVVWVALDPSMTVDGDVLAGSAEVRRVDDPGVTATLAFVVDC